jgi:hypothetical protein
MCSVLGNDLNCSVLTRDYKHKSIIAPVLYWIFIYVYASLENVQCNFSMGATT